jgi:hypothetical protein
LQRIIKLGLFTLKKETRLLWRQAICKAKRQAICKAKLSVSYFSDATTFGVSYAYFSWKIGAGVFMELHILAHLVVEIAF